MDDKTVYNKLLKQFKKDFSLHYSPLDFRSDVFVENRYGGTPAVSYKRGDDIVRDLYAWGSDYIENNKEYYPAFGGWEYNLMMEVEKLRSSTIKSLIDGIINDLIVNRKAPNFKIVNSYWDSDWKCAVVETSAYNKDLSFHVQLSGGEYLSQMGCMISTDEPETEQDLDWDDYLGFDSELIIKSAENSYDVFVAEQLLDDGRDWVDVDDVCKGQISATSYDDWKIQRALDDGSNWEYRVYPNSSGFTQPNDYSSKIDFEINQFFSEDGAREYIKNWSKS